MSKDIKGQYSTLNNLITSIATIKKEGSISYKNWIVNTQKCRDEQYNLGV